MVTVLDGSCGFGEWDNYVYVCRLEKLSLKDQKELLKKLWSKNHDKYIEWKSWCIRLNMLPDLFGTRDNPIPIDESKL